MSRTFKGKSELKIRTLHFVAVAFLLLILSLVLISSLLVGDHYCNEDHCIICFLSSNVTAFTVSIKAVCTLVFIVSALGIYKFNNNPSQTLITLKRKLTI